ncbi:MAG TPA: hypothetical protein VFS00_25740, partial [Polyangiaceae bacterium]|nr:hypothetical protein [Polyangiaceae bacterium]
DLYESRRAGGRWQRARPLTEINTPASELAHTVSPDGEWLYFSSTRPLTEPVGERFDLPRNDAALIGIGIGDGKGDIYRIPMGALGLGGRRPP